MNKRVPFPQQTVPVSGQFDMIVCGGGLAGIAAACTAVPVGKGIMSKVLKAKTPEEKLKIEEYAEIKHRQVALKMLKRLIKDVPDFSYKFDLEQKKKDEEKRIRDEQKKLRDAAKPKNPAVEKIKSFLFSKQTAR